MRSKTYYVVGRFSIARVNGLAEAAIAAGKTVAKLAKSLVFSDNGENNGFCFLRHQPCEQQQTETQNKKLPPAVARPDWSRVKWELSEGGNHGYLRVGILGYQVAS